MDFAHPNDAWMGVCIKLVVIFHVSCPTGSYSYTETGVVVTVCCFHRVCVVVMGPHHHMAAVIMVKVITYIVVITGRYGDTHRVVSL